MTFNPTPEQIEAAARILYDEFTGLVTDAWEVEHEDEKSYWTGQARAALVAAAGAAPQEPKDDFPASGNHAAPVQVDEAKLAEVERAAAEKAWDEGYAEGWNERDSDEFDPVNPYRRNEGEKA